MVPQRKGGAAPSYFLFDCWLFFSLNAVLVLFFPLTPLKVAAELLEAVVAERLGADRRHPPIPGAQPGPELGAGRLRGHEPLARVLSRLFH